MVDFYIGQLLNILWICVFFSFVHLDAAAVSALNLLPRPGTQTNSAAYKWQSILGVLDRCRTAQGHRLMGQWVKQPLRNEEVIRDRHDVVQCFVDASCTRDLLYDNYLKKMPDIMVIRIDTIGCGIYLLTNYFFTKALTKKLMRKKASLQDIYRLYQVVARIPTVVEALDELDHTTIDNVLTKPIKDILAVYTLKYLATIRFGII